MKMQSSKEGKQRQKLSQGFSYYESEFKEIVRNS